MILLQRAKSQELWFAPAPSSKECCSLKAFVQCQETQAPWGFVKEPFFTRLIDLESPFEEEFDKNVRYEIKRAQKESLLFSWGEEISPFVEFFNAFAQSKGLSLLNEAELSYMGEHLRLTEIRANGEPLVMHSYLLDHSIKRVRLLHSASLFRLSQEKDFRALVGRANRLLHFLDMERFKEEGFKIYDFGGVSHSQDPALLGINRFKEGFGGREVEEPTFRGWLFVALLKIFTLKGRLQTWKRAI